MVQATMVIKDLATIGEKLRAGLHRDLLRPGEDEYDKARKIHNGMIDRSPALIARCADASDVIQAVNVARSMASYCPCWEAATAFLAMRSANRA